MVGHGAEEHRVVRSLETEAKLVPRHGTLARGEHGTHRKLDLGAVAPVRERERQALLTGLLAHLDAQPAIDGACHLSDDAARLLALIGNDAHDVD